MSECLQQGDVLAAADWLISRRAAGTLSLDQDMRLSDRLGWAMTQDRALPAAAVRAAAERLGWLRGAPSGLPSTPWAKALQSRLDAEQWLASLRRDAASWTVWLGGEAAVAARVMLGRGKPRMQFLMRSDRVLKKRYGEFLLHAPVVSSAFDRVRVEAVGRSLTRRLGRNATALITLIAVFVTAWSAGIAASVIDPAIQDQVSGWTLIFMVAYWCRRIWGWSIFRRRRR